MTTIYATHPRYTAHDLPGHVERAERIRAVWRGLRRKSLNRADATASAASRRYRLGARRHTADYLDLLRRVSATPRTTLLDPDTYVGPDRQAERSRYCRQAVWSAAVDRVLQKVTAGNGLVGDSAAGTSRYAPIHEHGVLPAGRTSPSPRATPRIRYGIERVLIVDYDVHHGNGTEADVLRRSVGAVHLDAPVSALRARARRLTSAGRGESARSTSRCPPEAATPTTRRFSIRSSGAPPSDFTRS